MRTKRNSIICFVLMFLLCIGLRSNAAGPLDGEVIDGSLLTSNDSASDEKELVPEFLTEIVPYGTYLSNGSCNITKQGSGLVYISGATYCNRTSDKVYVEFSLEQLSNGGWHTIKSQTYATYNDTFAYTGASYAVSHGHYYRVKGYHYAKKGSEIESVSTCTSGIYID